jgi:diacylglycerol kinase family enzyme
MKSVDKETTVRVYSVGGDGTLFDCLNGIMGFNNVELAVIPYGRENIFVRGFGKDTLPLFRDISQQFNGKTIPLDVIRCGTNYAMSFCTIGMEADARTKILEIQNLLEGGNLFNQWLIKQFYTPVCYLGAAKAAFNHKVIHQNYELTVDGEDLGGKHSTINIANGAWYGEKLRPQSSARPDDGILDIIASRGGNPLEIIFKTPRYLKGSFTTSSADFTLRRGRKIVIRSKDPLIINLDDIVFFDTEITVEVLPGAVRFVDVTMQGYQGVRP